MAQLACLIAAMLWGFVYAVDGKLLKTITPTTIILFNGIISIIFCFFVFWSKGFDSSKFFGEDASLKIISITFVTHILTILASFLALSAIVKIGASTAAIIELSYPFFVIVFSWLLFGQTITKEVLFGGLLMFAGCLLIFSK